MGEEFKMLLGSEGVPFFTQRKAVPDYKDSFPTSMKPQPVSKVQVDVLDLAVPEDLVRYKNIWDGVGMRSITVFFENMEWIAEKSNWKVLIRWCVSGCMDPGELRDLRQVATTRMINNT